MDPSPNDSSGGAADGQVAAASAGPSGGGSKKRQAPPVFRKGDSLYRQLLAAAAQQPDSHGSPTTTAEEQGYEQHNRLPPPPSCRRRIPSEVLRHLERRDDVLPQGAWPLPPRASGAASTQAAAATVGPVPAFTVRRPPPDAMGLDDTTWQEDGRVLHLVPRVDAISISSASSSSPLAWLPARYLLQSVEIQPYPVPAPPVARLLDAALARVFGGGAGDGGKGQGQQQAQQQDGGEEEAEEGLSITLGDLARPAPPSSSSPAAATGGDQKPEEEWRLVRQCMGREVERLVDAMVGDALTLWGERVAAHREAEPGYVKTVGEERARGERKEEAGCDRWRDRVLGDWVSVLQGMELRARERAGVVAAAKAMKRKRASRAGRTEEREAYRRYLLAVDRAKHHKGRRAVGGTKDGEQEQEQEEAADWEVLAPALDPGVRARARARLEALLERR